MNRDDDTITDADRAFEEKARARLIDSSEALDGRIRSRLTAARFAAIGELERRGSAPRFRIPGNWLPAGALAAAAVLAVAVWVARPVDSATSVLADEPGPEDAEILASNDGPDLYSDDADFYEWAGSDSGGGAG